MYYRDCTKSYAAEVVREILDADLAPWEALDMIEAFLDNRINTDQIGNRL